MTVAYAYHSVFNLLLKVLTSSASLQASDSEFQTLGALTQKAFADRANGRWGTINKFLFEERSSRAGL